MNIFTFIFCWLMAVLFMFVVETGKRATLQQAVDAKRFIFDGKVYKINQVKE